VSVSVSVGLYVCVSVCLCVYVSVCVDYLKCISCKLVHMRTRIFLIAD
jgi:hypothetical protein